MGHVQGVKFRESMVLYAKGLGVSGWVRNRADGSVEAFAQGDHAAVEDLLQWARLGPPTAQVDALDTDPALPDPTLKTFERRENA